MTQISAQATTGPHSCEEDAKLASSLVMKPLKIRHYQLTKGEWMSGHGALKEDEVTDEEVVHQITVIHEDGFLRTYTVNEAEFELMEDNRELDTIEPDERRAQCLIENGGENVTKKIIEEKINSRNFKGGCEEGRKMMQEKAADLKEMRGTRIQFWDPTQADWFAGHILGMWSEKPKTHFLCAFDDETEYAIDPLKDTWQLDPEAPVLPLDQYKSKGFGRFVQASDGSEILEFIVLTKALKARLHVCCSKYCIRVCKKGRADGAGPTDDADTSDNESEMVSDETNRENKPSAEQAASGGDEDRKRKSRSKWWSAFSDKPLKIGEMTTEVIVNEAEKPVALKVRVPVETGDQERGAKKASVRKAKGRRPKAVR